MTLPPKDYIAARRKELTDTLQSVRDELAMLDRMESAIPKPPPEVFRATQEEMELEVQRTGRRHFERSIKDMVLDVLENTSGMLALDILHAIKERFGVEVERTSLSPQLTRLKSDSWIIAKENIWQLTDAGRDSLAEMRRMQRKI